MSRQQPWEYLIFHDLVAQALDRFTDIYLRHDGNVNKMAEVMGMNRCTIYNWMRQLKLPPRRRMMKFKTREEALYELTLAQAKLRFQLGRLEKKLWDKYLRKWQSLHGVTNLNESASRWGKTATTPKTTKKRKKPDEKAGTLGRRVFRSPASLHEHAAETEGERPEAPPPEGVR